MRRSRKRGLAGLAVLGITVVVGLLAAWGVNPVATSEIAPADVVALRFPADWMTSDEATGTAQADVPAATPASFQLASAGETQLPAGFMFSPRPTYATPLQPVAAPAPQPSAPAVAAPVAGTKVEAKVEPKAATRPETKPVAPTRSIAAAAPQPHKPAARKKDSGELFNEAQLASIKTRLKLSDYQEQYWPPVENALRAIGRSVARGTPPKTTAMGYASESRLAAQIDPDSDEVQQLKSAAFPLIMSMNDDQKQQVRNIAHVMGLERVASSF
jgi:hypothetical protein